MNRGTTIHARALSMLLAQGEGETTEFKRSTGEMKEGMQTLCAFLNGSGGTVLFGIRPDGAIAGQQGFLIVTFKAQMVAGSPAKPKHPDHPKTSVKTSVKIIALLQDNPSLTLSQLAEAVGVAKRSVERNIQQLQEDGQLKRIGPDKGGHWEVPS